MTTTAQETKHVYQAMFLLDNEEVRKGFNAQRDWLRGTLEKHGIDVRVLRLWQERQLAYTIGQRKRATYLLGWLEATGDAVNAVKRELYLLGPVFRVLFLREDSIPDDELEVGIQEIRDEDVVIPEDVVEEEPEEPVTEEAEQAEKEAPKEESEGKGEAESGATESGATESGATESGEKAEKSEEPEEAKS